MTNAEPPQQATALNVDQTLQLAITFHQAGQLQNAEQIYRAILQAHPNHPDANHNLGILAIQTNQPVVGLPYFLAALEADSTQEQYWLSYIDALFQAGQLETAREVLSHAQQQGLQGPAADALARRLESGVQITEPSPPPLEESPSASSAATQNNQSEPEAKPVKTEKSLKKFAPQQKKNPSPQMINTLVDLFNKGRYAEATTLAQTMTERFPLNWVGWKMLGVIFTQMGRSADALIPMQKAAALSPGDAEAHSNLGFTLHDLGRLEEAEASHRRALRIKPNYAAAHSNLGLTLMELGVLEEAETSHRRALAINPDIAKAHYNLGETLYYRGNQDQAVVSWKQALAIEPNGIGLIAATWLALLYWLEGNYDQYCHMIIASAAITTTTDDKHKPHRIYREYLGLLQSHQQAAEPQHEGMKTLYVVGESHSLSAHGVVVRYHEREMRCSALWIMGCKQWHLGNSKASKHKHRFEAIMANIPRHSTILLTIGEIDCRPTEGILKAWKKSPGKSLEDVARATASGYVSYVKEMASKYGHQAVISGVPATNVKLDALEEDVSGQLVRLIGIFNTALKDLALSAGMDFLDVYNLTNRGDGIASGQWHIDDYHLLPSAMIEAFERHCLQSNK